MELIIKRCKSRIKLQRRASWFNNVIFGPVFLVATTALIVGAKCSPIDEDNPDASFVATVKLVTTGLFLDDTITKHGSQD